MGTSLGGHGSGHHTRCTQNCPWRMPLGSAMWGKESEEALQLIYLHITLNSDTEHVLF